MLLTLANTTETAELSDTTDKEDTDKSIGAADQRHTILDSYRRGENATSNHNKRKTKKNDQTTSKIKRQYSAY